jgi:hypothetical protein
MHVNSLIRVKKSFHNFNARLSVDDIEKQISGKDIVTRSQYTTRMFILLSLLNATGLIN